MSFTLEIKKQGRFKFDSNIKKYKLFSLTKDFFGVDLEKLHNIFPPLSNLLNFDNDQSTLIHKKFYELGETKEFFEVYLEYVRNEVAPFFQIDGELLVQTTPTFRVQVPNNIAVAEFHKDSDYSHNSMESNIFLPLTDAIESSTIQAESKSQSGNFSPLNAKVGEMYIWDGANCLHGNSRNLTDWTRVSFDFRILPKKYYDSNSKLTSITAKRNMTIGDYWYEL